MAAQEWRGTKGGCRSIAPLTQETAPCNVERSIPTARSSIIYACMYYGRLAVSAASKWSGGHAGLSRLAAIWQTNLPLTVCSMAHLSSYADDVWTAPICKNCVVDRRPPRVHGFRWSSYSTSRALPMIWSCFHHFSVRFYACDMYSW